MSKTVYIYDEITGEHVGQYEAQESPLEPGKFITPEASTDIQPLPAKSGFAVCFNAGIWEYKTDTRGIWFKSNGDVVEVGSLDTVIDVDWSRNKPPPTTAELKQEKRLEINTAFEQSMQQIVGSYPSNEVSSWAKQEAEARAYEASNAAPTPLIDALAATRGVAKVDLVSRIIGKADLFATVSGQLIGHRQGLEDTLDALPETATAEDIAAISW